MPRRSARCGPRLHHRRREHNTATVQHVHVATAHARRRDAYDDLVGARFEQLDLFDVCPCLDVVDHHGFHQASPR